MSTLIAFSGANDYIYVDEDVSSVTEALAARNDAGLSAELTQVPLQGDAFQAAPVMVNADRVAYVRAA